jgi:hypothetical protein
LTPEPAFSHMAIAQSHYTDTPPAYATNLFWKVQQNLILFMEELSIHTQCGPKVLGLIFLKNL